VAASFLDQLLAVLQATVKPVQPAPPAAAAPPAPPPAGSDLLALQRRIEALEASQGRIIVHLMQSGIPLGAAFGPTTLPPA
jgi:hypothetical protein